MNPENILNNPLLNKGTAFTEGERNRHHLHGLLPHHVSTIEEQVQRRYQNFLTQTGDIAKHLFLTALQNRNEILFYRLVYEHITEMLPLIYTPTVGDISTHYSSLYTEHRGLYLSYPLRERADEILSRINDIDVIVATDGERILGLGDLGVGGMAIPVGKLALYSLFGGIHPGKTLPVMLDIGTNNPDLLKDPLYLGWRHERIIGKEYDAFIEIFVKAVKKKFPKVLLQWEDFGKEHAKPILERYQNEICSFNDDIQGTAAVVLSGILAAVKLNKSTLAQQRIVVVGAGSAGIGISEILLGALKQEKKALYLVDTNGLIHTGQSHLASNQLPFARPKEEISKWKETGLSDVIRQVHPTVLIGVSTQAGVFTQEIVTEMAKHVEHPVIFPLSNPTSHSEAHPADLLQWTKGKAIIATGSPFDPVQYQGRVHPIAQCNNVYIFPGVGLGIISCKAKKATNRMFYRAAEVLSENSPMLQNPSGTLFPSFEHLREISKKIAIAVVEIAQEEGLGIKGDPPSLVNKAMWFPDYA